MKLQILITSLLVATLAIPAWASVVGRFDDIPPGHARALDIKWAVESEWLKGYPDGSFRPDPNITTAHMARALDRMYPNGMTRGEFASLIV